MTPSNSFVHFSLNLFFGTVSDPLAIEATKDCHRDGGNP
jgi:hypothetical protein